MNTDFKFKGCNIKIKNFSQLVTIGQCVKFSLKYLSACLTEQIVGYDGFVYTPNLVEKKANILIEVKDHENKIKLFLNKDIHIEITPHRFHNMQMRCEPHSFTHTSFFAAMHAYDFKGIDIMSV